MRFLFAVAWRALLNTPPSLARVRNVWSPHPVRPPVFRCRARGPCPRGPSLRASHAPSSAQFTRTLYFLLIFTQFLACLSILFFRHMEVRSIFSEAATVWETWVIATYWIWTCLSTVGFGDIFPTTNGTRVYSLFVMFFSIYMNVYLLTTRLAPALQKGVIQQKMDEKKGKLAAVLQFYKVLRGRSVGPGPPPPSPVHKSGPGLCLVGAGAGGDPPALARGSQ